MAAYTLSPLLVFVESALCLAISTDSSGAPLHDRVIGAHTVFYWVVLGTVWRIVDDENVHSDGLGQSHKFLFEYMMQV